MRVKPGPLLLNAVLIAGAALTIAPLLWMLSASLMPTGQANCTRLQMAATGTVEAPSWSTRTKMGSKVFSSKSMRFWHGAKRSWAKCERPLVTTTAPPMEV